MVEARRWADDLLAHAPRLRALADAGWVRPLREVLPAVTCTAQATLLTGAAPDRPAVLACFTGDEGARTGGPPARGRTARQRWIVALAASLALSILAGFPSTAAAAFLCSFLLAALLTMLAGGTPPDASIVDGYNEPEIITRGTIVELSPYAQKTGIDKADYDANQWNENSCGGKLYSFHSS